MKKNGDKNYKDCIMTAREVENILHQEYIKIQLNEIEKIILSSLDKKYKYIKRSSLGYLKVLDGDYNSNILDMFNDNLFQYFEKEKVYSIESLLKGENKDDIRK